MSKQTIGRRRALTVIGGAGTATVFGCTQAPAAPSSTVSTASGDAACAEAPNETAGPFPSLSDLVRSDIREGRPGTPLGLTVRVVNVNAGCSALAGANVEIWQCDAIGDYSQYGSQRTESFLRGLQATNGQGEVAFTTIYPGWYPGRATHIHLGVAVGGRSVKVTQLAFPESISNEVHRQGAYAGRGANPTTNASDGIFADSLSAQLVSISGDVANGFSARIDVGVAV